MNNRILAINPGSTSTKIAVFDAEKQIFTTNIQHKSEEIATFSSVSEQFSFRKNAVLVALEQAQIPINTIEIVIGRGGLLYPLQSGVYIVDETMKKDLKNSQIGQHACNLGGLIADNIASELPNVQAYIADPVVVDEMENIARFTGLKTIQRRSVFHALNQKAVARAYSKQIGIPYEKLNLIVTHLGGGISVGAHMQGKVIDVNNALNGDGPFTPERAGTIPAADLVELCFSGKNTKKEILKMLNGKGGLVDHLSTNQALEALNMAKTDDYAAKVIEALCYNIAKYVGQMAVALSGKVDAIIITGGMAHSDYIVSEISKRVGFISKIVVFPGEDEMEALASNALMVLKGEIEPKIYLGRK